MAMKPWSPEELALCRRLWNRGLSASQVSEQLAKNSPAYRRTRTSILGRMNRDMSSIKPEVKASMTRQKGPVVPTKRAPSLPKPKIRRESSAEAMVSPVVIPLPKTLRTLDSPVSRPWTTRKFEECSWPIERGEDLHSCCQPVKPGKVYCQGHYDIAYYPPKPRSPKAQMKRPR